MFDKNKLNFGTAGIPQTTLINYPNSKNNTLDGISEINNLDLDALEIEFVRSVYLKKSTSEKLKELRDNAISKKVNISIHAPYFINLNAKEEYKIENSINYILDSLLVGHEINANTVLFHPGYFLKQERKPVLEKINSNIIKILNSFEELKNKKVESNVRLGLELTGKESQVGSLEDSLYFYENLNNRNVVPVFDFSHVHARYNGYFLDKNNLKSFFEKLDSYPKLYKNIHCHLSGIEYTSKGERKHLMLEESDMPYKEILSNLKERKATGTIICESPIPYKDALLLKKEYSLL